MGAAKKQNVCLRMGGEAIENIDLVAAGMAKKLGIEVSRANAIAMMAREYINGHPELREKTEELRCADILSKS